MTFPRAHRAQPRRSATSPARTARSATARACSSGYRWYDTRHVPTLLPVRPRAVVLVVRDRRARASGRRPGAGEALTRVRCRSPTPATGAGSEVVQGYVAPPPPRPCVRRAELKAFAKVALDPGEPTTVELAPRPSRVRRLGPGRPAPTRAWVVEPGRYELQLGRSSADLATSSRSSAGTRPQRPAVSSASSCSRLRPITCSTTGAGSPRAALRTRAAHRDLRGAGSRSRTTPGRRRGRRRAAPCRLRGTG